MFKKLTIIALMALINAGIVAETAKFEEKTEISEAISSLNVNKFREIMAKKEYISIVEKSDLLDQIEKKSQKIEEKWVQETVLSIYIPTTTIMAFIIMYKTFPPLEPLLSKILKMINDFCNKGPAPKEDLTKALIDPKWKKNNDTFIRERGLFHWLKFMSFITNSRRFERSLKLSKSQRAQDPPNDAAGFVTGTTLLAVNLGTLIYFRKQIKPTLKNIISFHKEDHNKLDDISKILNSAKIV